PTVLGGVLVLAGTGILASLTQRRRAGIFLSAMTLLCALGFVWAPQGRLWNARLLPFWFLCVWLLAGIAVFEGITFLADAAKNAVGDAADPTEVNGGAAGRPDGATATAVRNAVLRAGPVVALVGALVYVGFPLRALPGGHVDKVTGEYGWLGITTGDKSFVHDWVFWNYSGYRSS